MPSDFPTAEQEWRIKADVDRLCAASSYFPMALAGVLSNQGDAVMALLSTIAELRETVASYEAMKEGVSLRIADLEAERDRLRAALAWYAAEDARSVADGVLESVYHRPAAEAMGEQA